jgi:DNA (cytosine-5)-methyltransferase 1
MSKRPLALDLFCGAGGAGMGLHQAGFDVVGVDLIRQPRYPFPFVQGDALRPPFDLSRFDLVWSSPPCQANTAMKTMHNAKKHIDLIPQTRALLRAAGVLYVIENVVGAALQDPVLLCGSMFGLGAAGAQLRRHRLFESNFHIPQMECRHTRPTIGVYGGHIRNRKRREGSHARGVADFSKEDGYRAMRIDWMTLEELSESIPPAYSEFIGLAARQAMMVKAAA